MNERCRRCRFRAPEWLDYDCDYMHVTGKIRGGKLEECTKFEPDPGRGGKVCKMDFPSGCAGSGSGGG